MKQPHYNVVWMICLLGFGALLTAAHAAEVGDVQSPVKRQESLDRAKKLLAPRDTPPPAADPFHSEAFNLALAASSGHQPGTTPAVTENLGTQPAGPRTGRDLLQAIAAGLKPTGSYVLGGQPMLVFGQKRVKAGGLVTIKFEGTEYTVEIVAIEPPNFTLRLNREDFTRPIK